MLCFPNCKINLGLRVVRKLENGYHELQTVFYPVPLNDVLEILPAVEETFVATGIETGRVEDNLCVKAYRLLKKDFPQLPPVTLHLHKIIPIGAGLGGGSADAAFTLKALSQLFHLEIPEEKLQEYALTLGSDCPFFIINKPCLAGGRGEQLVPITIDMKGYTLVLINPGIHINTGWAFSQLHPSVPSFPVAEIIADGPETWREELINDFEGPVFSHYPEIRLVKEQLYSFGAVYASMSGSGSTVYGLFKEKMSKELLKEMKYFHRIIDL
jgi:4-diphosphocytidyl-2-C-methyl-D-erythritol kinase